MNKWYEKIKGWYESGWWTKSMVKNAVVKEKITADEYKDITGEYYNDLMELDESTEEN